MPPPCETAATSLPQDEELAVEARDWQARAHAAYTAWSSSPAFAEEAGHASRALWLRAVALVESRAFAFKARPPQQRYASSSNLNKLVARMRDSDA
jgi:hypothetical protein